MNTIIIQDIHSTCPSCKVIENKKLVCRNCGYEYKEKDDPLWIKILFTLSAIVLITLIVSFLGIVSDFIFSDRTLSQYLNDFSTRIMEFYSRLIN